MARSQGVELVFDGGYWAEGPRWHEGALFYSDIGAGKVWRLAPDGSRSLVARDIPGASGLGWTAAGDLLVAGIVASTVYRLGKDGTPSVFCGPDSHGTAGTNDMASAMGRSYVTCSGRESKPDDTVEDAMQPCGTVVMVDHATGEGRVVLSGYRMPNGIGFTPDGRHVIVSELFAQRLLRFTVAEDGSLVDETVFATLHAPCDGLCIDAEGHVWASTIGDFVRIDPAGAAVMRVTVDEDYACIACALGGEDGRDLYLLASQSQSPADVFARTSHSRIYRTRAPAPMMPALPR